MTASLLSLFFSLFTPVVLEYLKSKPWAPFINRNTGTLNTITGIVVAVANVFGVSFYFDAAAKTLTVSGLDAVSAVTLAATFALSWLLQEVIYRTTVKQ